ncbi:hypothetical protein ACQUJS_22910 [Ralstonia pseudosolanacearum]
MARTLLPQHCNRQPATGMVAPGSNISSARMGCALSENLNTKTHKNQKVGARELGKT